MKIVQRISTEGRIVIPLEIRKVMGIKAGDDLELEFDNTTETLTVKSAKAVCRLCGSDRDFSLVGKHVICNQCINIIKGI